MADIWRAIQDDHAEIDELLGKLEKSKEEELALEICDLLAVHSRVEEKLLYPRLDEADEDLAEQAREQHEEIENITEELADLSPEDEDFGKLIDELVEAVRGHVEFEEGKIFNALRGSVKTAEAQKLAREYEKQVQQEFDQLESEDAEEETEEEEDMARGRGEGGQGRRSDDDDREQRGSTRSGEDETFAPIDLNSASEKQLAEIPMIGEMRAKAIMLARPFANWEDLERAAGFNQGMIDDLKAGGATLGESGGRRDRDDDDEEASGGPQGQGRVTSPDDKRLKENRDDDRSQGRGGGRSQSGGRRRREEEEPA